MEFQTKYVISTEAIKSENKDKIIISNDAFAVGEVIEELIKKIEKVRIALI